MQENNDPVSVKTHLSEPTKQVFKILGIATIIYVAFLLITKDKKTIKKVIKK